METEDIILCCGCLSPERKMVQLEEHHKKQCFMQIVNEISVSIYQEIVINTYLNRVL